MNIGSIGPSFQGKLTFKVPYTGSDLINKNDNHRSYLEFSEKPEFKINWQKREALEFTYLSLANSKRFEFATDGKDGKKIWVFPGKLTTEEKARLDNAKVDYEYDENSTSVGMDEVPEESVKAFEKKRDRINKQYEDNIYYKLYEEA